MLLRRGAVRMRAAIHDFFWTDQPLLQNPGNGTSIPLVMKRPFPYHLSGIKVSSFLILDVSKAP